MKKTFLIAAAVIFFAAACNTVPVQPSLDSRVKTAVETALGKPGTPVGSKLIAVKVEGNLITLNFTKEITSEGWAIFEDTFQRVSNAITDVIEGDLGREVGYTILIEGQPLNEYRASMETASWKIYTNSRFGFQLTFTDAWQGYKVFSSEGSQGVGRPTYIQFSLPTSDKSSTVINVTDEMYGYFAPLTITIYPKEIWDMMPDGQKSGWKVLGQTATDIYLTRNATSGPDNFNVAEVLTTFKLTK
ncbi:MAG: hypothetical protein U1C57_03505 [Candidatus Doudnabacteria bacterium]|nr:hypothetical protein [bacterium]MDZ4244143.1 hypothetical protein [Candidatus Doudnabacteria bacterium]